MRNKILVSQVRIPFTKFMAVLLALVAVTLAAIAMTIAGHGWAKAIAFSSAGIALWIGFPLSILAMFGRVHDDRGRDGMYSYLDADERQRNDRWRGVYPACVATLSVAILGCWVGYIDGFVFHEGTSHLALHDSGRVLERTEASELFMMCCSVCAATSMFMAYVLRQKGGYLTSWSLCAALLCLLLIALLWATEVASTSPRSVATPRASANVNSSTTPAGA